MLKRITLKKYSIFRFVAWVNIFFQLLFPLSISFSPAVIAASTNYPTLSQVDENENNEDQVERRIASGAISAGNLISGDAKASNMAREMISSQASSEVQQWMNQFGNSRVTLSLDEKAQLKNSQFDLLLPLAERESDLLFSQTSLHRTDDRSHLNLGLGTRHFTTEFMIGGNLFYDRDMTRSHSRAGVGLEYWRDDLKLAANGYHRLSGWQTSPDFVDYRERPASGWDIRAEAFLPMYPQLGGKLVYEKYYGNEVALFGKDKLQRNPHALTSGISYTPIPLISFDAEHRQGKGNANDSRLGLNVNWQIGKSIDYHLSGDAVASMRSLKGSRYDFVDRNNTIVLEYQKETVITFVMPDSLRGPAWAPISFATQVDARHGFERIEWTAPDLVKAGGKISSSGNSHQIHLPGLAASSRSAAANTYVLQGVAIDKKGNRSQVQETLVYVDAPDINPANSLFEPTHSVLPTDGQSTQELILSVRDIDGNFVNIPASEIKVDISSDQETSSGKVSVVKEISTGKFSLTVTAGTDVEKVTLTPQVNGVKLASADVTMMALTPERANSTIATDSAHYLAGDDIVVTVALNDVSGNAVMDASSWLTADAINVPNAEPKSGNSWVDNNDGTYTSIFVAKTAAINLKATLNLKGWSDKVQSEIYKIAPSSPAQAYSTIGRDRDNYAAGSEMIINVTLQDAQGNAVVGASRLLAGTVDVPNAAPKSDSNWTDDNTGTYTRTYVAKTAGVALNAELNMGGWSGKVQSQTYSITAGAADRANSTIERDLGNYIAGNEMIIEVTLKDAQGNPVTGESALLASEVMVNNADLKPNSWTESSAGTYRGTYIAKTVGTNLKAGLELNGWNGKIQSQTYSITAGAADRVNSTIERDSSAYTAGNEMLIEVTLKDAQGNPVTGESVLLASEVRVNNADLKPNSWTESSAGTYRGTYIAKTVGTNLKAGLELNGWNGKIQSQPYSITAGAADRVNSTIDRDLSAYTAGNEMIIEVTLKDAQGNPVTGESALLASEVMVNNADLKPGSWTESSVGTYRGIYIAKRVGIDLKAGLDLGGFSGGSGKIQSQPYSITAGVADRANSTIERDLGNYTAGNEMIIEVTLKDAQGNPVTGEATLLASEVMVNNADLKPGSWTENSVGTYRGIYIAKRVGTDLKAGLDLGGFSGGSGKIQSQPYSITAGVADRANSTIERDLSAYTAGNEMRIEVTLKDAQGNPVTGESALLASEVKVENADLKPNSWTETSVGTYRGIYIAETVGTNLKASLELSDWSSKVQSQMYSITAGVADRASSTIERDLSNYTAGKEITITVTLKDAQGNPVTGESAVLASAVEVENADLKSGSWTENSEGSYRGIYIAKTAGTNLKAGLQRSGWSGKIQSEAYSIKADMPAQANSVITVDDDSYIAGDEIAVTVTLEDAQGNAVTGYSPQLSTGMATIRNADPKSGSSWIDKGDGSYSRIYIAKTVGSEIKASLTLGGWSSYVFSQPYSITAGQPDFTKSVISVDSSQYYTVGTHSSVIVSIMLKDTYGNTVAGSSSLLTTSAITVPNAEFKSGNSWVDSGNGIYTRTYVAKTAGTNLKATMKLSGWSNTVMSDHYDIVEPITIVGVQANGHTFDKDAGFPTTGFNGATFTLELNYGNVTNFTWTSNSSWVSVSNRGVISFSGTGNGNTVTITGTPNNGSNGGINVTYTFKLKKWFINNDNQSGSWSSANTWCNNQSGGYRLPTYNELTTNYSGIRERGGLWSEWGSLESYSNSRFYNMYYWTSEAGPNTGQYNAVELGSGSVTTVHGSNSGYVFITCSKSL